VRDVKVTGASISFTDAMLRDGVPSLENCELRVRVEGQLTFNATSQQINAALAGLGLVYTAAASALTPCLRGPVLGNQQVAVRRS
jgi:hypothetical protein